MQRFSSFDGTTIAYNDVGDGLPVVLVHGYTTTAERNWFLPGTVNLLISEGWRVVAPDLRGHGQSDKPGDFDRYEDWALARDIVALADHLGLSQFHLVGYSLGSIVAGTVALLDDRLVSLTLGGVGDHIMIENWDRPRQLVAGLSGDDAAAAAEPMVDRVRQNVAALGGSLRAMAAVQHGHVELTPSKLRQIAVPTTLICGDGDDLNGDPDALAAAIPGATVVRVPGDHASVMDSQDFGRAIALALRDNNSSV